VESVDEPDAAREAAADDVDDWWRVVAAAAWEHLDASGSPVSVESVSPPGTSPTGADGSGR
jgi:hypothetical protein